MMTETSLLGILAPTQLITIFFLGFLHALEPGHGKTALLAHIASSRSQLKDCLVLAFITSITHFASIILLSLIVHGLVHYFLLDHISEHEIIPIMTGISSLILIVVAFRILRNQKKSALPCCKHHQEAKEWKWTATIGISGGLIPCPTALAAFATSIKTTNITNSILYLTLFSISIFLSLTLFIIVARRFSHRFQDYLQRKNWGSILQHNKAYLFIFIGLVQILFLF